MGFDCYRFLLLIVRCTDHCQLIFFQGILAGCALLWPLASVHEWPA